MTVHEIELPDMYVDAECRCVLPFCKERKRFGIGIDIPGQPTLRFAFTPQNLVFMISAIKDYSNSFAANQSDGSELILKDLMLVPSDVGKVAS